MCYSVFLFFSVQVAWSAADASTAEATWFPEFEVTLKQPADGKHASSTIAIVGVRQGGHRGVEPGRITSYWIALGGGGDSEAHRVQAPVAGPRG